MQNLFEQYGVKHKIDCSNCRSFKHYGGVCNLDTQPTCPQANHNYSITSDKVIALEEVALDDYYYLVKVPSSDGLEPNLYCWFDTTNMKRGSFKSNTRVKALSNLLKARYDDYTEQEREQIREVLRG